MTPEQRAFVEDLLDEWVEYEESFWDRHGSSGEHSIAPRRAEFERLFPREGA